MERKRVTIYWRGDRAYLNWTEGGRRKRPSLGKISPVEAETARQAKEFELRTGKKLLATGKKFGDFANEYLAWHEQKYPDSHERIEQIIADRFIQFKDVPLDAITAYDIEMWQTQRSKDTVNYVRGHIWVPNSRGRHKLEPVYQKRPISRGTLLKELRALSALFNRAVIWGLVQQNPVKLVEKPKDRKEKPVVWYTKEELQRLYEASGHKADWWRLMANTGLRAAEARHLKWTDIRDKRLHVLSREGARTKSGHWRQIPLSKGAEAALKALRKANANSEYVLPPMHSKSLSRACKADLKRAGLGGSLHCLRHTFGSTLASAGVPLREIQALMGHASMKTTEIYAHLAPENLKAAVTRLDL